MSWKYLIGKTLHKLEDRLAKSKNSFVIKNYPYGRNWIFDVNRFLKLPIETIIDAGANVGSISKELSIHFPKSKIFAFEPVLSTFNSLEHAVSKFKNVYPKNYGLGDKNEKIEISLNSENTINSIKTNYNTEIANKEFISILRIDDFLRENSISRINILKIDVEGYEFEVLNGCGNLLKDNIDVVLLEVGYQREPSKVHFSDVENYMEKYGYQLCGIYEIMRNQPNKHKIAYSNNLYIRQSLLVD